MKTQINKNVSNIYVTFQKVGYHRYPDAPSEPFDVSYLKNIHRHLFKFRVSIQVFHENRELEFHQFLNWLHSLYDKELNLDYKSCEMISDELNFKIAEKYPNRKVSIEVSEDGECGSYCEYFNLTDNIEGSLNLESNLKPSILDSQLALLEEDLTPLNNEHALG
jgi:hypothetical protein